MKKINFLLFSLLLVLFSSCFTSSISYKKLSGIHKGMLPKEVIAILGEPKYRSFEGNVEIWEYRDYFSRYDDVSKIWFTDNKVSKLESFSDRYNVFPCPNKSSDDAKKEEEKKKSSDEDTASTGVIVTSKGNYIKTKSMIITPSGDHILIHKH